LIKHYLEVVEVEILLAFQNERVFFEIFGVVGILFIEFLLDL
jgi:hypothetical protein